LFHEILFLIFFSPFSGGMMGFGGPASGPMGGFVGMIDRLFDIPIHFFPIHFFSLIFLIGMMIVF
jgi:hypothetical protein